MPYESRRSFRAKAFALAVGAHAAGLRVGIIKRASKEFHQAPAMRDISLHLGKLGATQISDASCSFDVRLPRI